MADIIRERKESEKNLKEGGFLDIRKWRANDVKQGELKKISDIEHESIYKKRVPFCRTCALEELDKKILNINKKVKDSIDKGDYDVKINFDIDYSKFSGEENFALVDETEIEEDKLLDGIRQTVATGKYKNYVCKVCKNARVSIEFKNRETETSKLKNNV